MCPPRARKRSFELDDFFLLKFASDPRISPDGENVAFVLTSPDREKDDYASSIWIAGEDSLRQLTHAGKDGTPRWSPDGDRLAFLRRDDEGKAQVWVIRMDGGDARLLTSAPEGVTDFVWSPEGQRIAFSAITDPSGEPGEVRTSEKIERLPIVIRRGLFKADGYGYLRGRRRHLFALPAGGGDAIRLTEGDFDVASPTWSPDGSEIAFVASMHEERDLDFVSHVFAVGSEGGEPRQITDWMGTAAMPTWSPGGETILLAGKSVPRSDRHTRLFRLDPAGGTPSEIAPDFDRNVMVGAPGYPGAPPQVTADGGSVVFCARDGGCTHAYTVPLEGGVPQKILGGPERTVFALSLASTPGRIAFLATAPDIPVDLFVAGLDGESEVRLTHLNEQVLSQMDLPSQERRVFAAPGGGEIEGWVLHGRSEGKGPPPLLLDVHGGPHNAHGPSFPSIWLYRLVLAAQGWNILFINSRGSDGYGEEFFGALSGGWGENDLGDFMSAIDSLVDEGLADPDRLAVTGYSYGGFMTNWMVTQTDRFAAAVTGGCVTNLLSDYGTSDYGPFLSWEIGGEAYENRDRYLALSPISHVKRVTTPVLILHGQSDDRCDAGEAEQWFASLRRQRKIVEMVLYPGASHLFILQGPPSYRIDYNRRVVDWVTRHTGGKAHEDADPKDRGAE